MLVAVVFLSQELRSTYHASVRTRTGSTILDFSDLRRLADNHDGTLTGQAVEAFVRRKYRWIIVTLDLWW